MDCFTCSRERCVEYLVGQDDFNLKSGACNDGNIIHYAALCEKMSPDYLLELLKAVRTRLDVNIQDHDGHVLFHFLFRNQHRNPHLITKTKYMLAAQLNLNTRCSMGVRLMEDFSHLVNNSPLFYELVSVVQRHTQKRRREI